MIDDKRDDRRELGIIESWGVKWESSHDVWSATIVFDFVNGGGQAFQACLPKDLIDVWKAEIITLFGTQDIVGKRAYALRYWGKYNETIEGVEYKRRIWTRHGFQKRHCNEVVISPIAQKKNSIQSEINSFNRRVVGLKQELLTINNNYIDWSEKDTF